MTKIALLGAGGKMGVRLATNLQKTAFDIAPVEVAEAGRARLKAATGLDCLEEGQALSRADVVLMAVPDRMIGEVAHQVVPKLDPGAAVIVLDAAAPHAGEMPERADVTYFVTHPCHPPLFNDETDPAKKADYFGGVGAKQHIVCALMQGPEEHYALCEEVARAIYAPVMRSHRLVGRLAEREQAAHDFILGHLNIELAIAFGLFPEGRFSDGALHAIAQARPLIFREGWLERVFAPENVLRSVKDICHPDQAA